MNLNKINDLTDLLVTNHGYEFLYVCDEVVAGHAPNFGYFRAKDSRHALVDEEINDYVKDHDCLRLNQAQIEKLMMEIQ